MKKHLFSYQNSVFVLILFLVAFVVACKKDEGTSSSSSTKAAAKKSPIKKSPAKTSKKMAEKKIPLGDEGEVIEADLMTTKGNIKLKLFSGKTPLTVGNFLFLAKKGFYDGVKFHRVVKDFVIQGGDPTGTGMGGPGYRFEDEFHHSLKHSKAGILSMANAGPNTNGSQFFITHRATPHLDGRHSVFGEVIDGLDTIYKIEKGDTIKKLVVKGDTKGLFSKLNTRIPKWEKALAAKK